MKWISIIIDIITQLVKLFGGKTGQTQANTPVEKLKQPEPPSDAFKAMVEEVRREKEETERKRVEKELVIKRQKDLEALQAKYKSQITGSNTLKDRLFQKLKDIAAHKDIIKDPENINKLSIVIAPTKNSLISPELTIVKTTDIERHAQTLSIQKPLTPKKKIKLGVIIGHNSQAQGANMNLKGDSVPKTEYQFHSIVAYDYIKPICDATEVIEVVVLKRTPISDIQGAYERAKQVKCDLVIELHFNAANAMVKGTETLCSKRPDDMIFGEIVHKHLCAAFERVGTSRGVKPILESARGGYAVYYLPAVPNCLTEAFFGDNSDEAQYAWSHKKSYSIAIRDAVLEYAKQEKFI